MQNVMSDKFSTITLLGAETNLASMLPVKFELNHEFTLNNYLNIFPNQVPATRPVVAYYGIGIGGCYNVDDESLSAAYNPQRMDMNLYKPIPFRCVPIDEDLTPEERSLYRLRQRATINGTEYFLYWLKKMEFNDGIKYQQQNADGTTTDYILDPSHLNPVPVKPDSNEVINTINPSVIAYVEANINIYGYEVLEYINAYYGNNIYAKISELGLYTGVDKEVQGMSGQNTPFTYTEAIFTKLYMKNTWIGTPLTDRQDAIEGVQKITTNGTLIKS